MAKSKKIVIAVVTIILAVAVIFFSRWLIRYYFYNDYRDKLSSYEYEEGTQFCRSSLSRALSGAVSPVKSIK